MLLDAERQSIRSKREKDILLSPEFGISKASGFDPSY